MVADFVPKGAKVLKMAGADSAVAPPGVVPMQVQPLQGQVQPVPQMGNESCPSGLCDTGRIPRGAKSVPMAGQRPPQQERGTQMGCGCTEGAAPKTIPNPETLEGAERSETHVIRVEGLGSDGQKYIADVEVEFPIPAKVMGIRHAPVR